MVLGHMYCTGISGSSGFMSRRRLFFLCVSLVCSPLDPAVLRLSKSGLLGLGSVKSSCPLADPFVQINPVCLWAKRRWLKLGRV